MKSFEKILIPTDFSECCNRALEYAFTMASKFDAELLVLHVIDGRALQSISSYSYGEVAEDYLTKHSHEDMAQEIKKILADEIKKGTDYDNKLKVTTMVRYGVPWDQIIQVAEEEKVDFIVVGARGETAMSEALMGGVASKVARRAPCPVFLVRRRRAK